MIKELLKVFIDRLEMSEDEAVIAAVFCIAGFSIDSLFFVGGMPPGTVTLLSGTSGFLGAKLIKKTPFYKRYVIRQLDKLINEGHLNEREGKEMKERIIKKWYSK